MSRQFDESGPGRRYDLCSPTVISSPIVLCFFHRERVFGRHRSLAKRFLISTELSIPAVLLWNQPAPDEPLRGF
jgi:hypothetical protein